MTKLENILSKYDDPNKTGFDYYDVEREIHSLPDDVVYADDVQAELLAMAFQDGAGKDYWNTYYGPIISGTRTNKKTGETEPAYTPDYQMITPKHFDYWYDRAVQTHNPLMRMRYLGLIFDFQKKILGIEPDYRKVKLPYVETIIQVVQGEYYHYEVAGILYTERAFYCATALHNQVLIEDSKNVLLLLNQRYRNDDDSPGLWGRCFQLMLNYRVVFAEEEVQQLVGESEERFRRFEELALAKGCLTDNYAHLLKDQAELLCQYYGKEGKVEKIEDVLDRVCAAIRLSANLRGGVWFHGMLNQMQSIYRQYHLEKKATKLYIDIQRLGRKTLQEMQLVEIPLQLNPELIEQYIKEFLSGSDKQILQRYIVRHIPNLTKEKQYQLEEIKKDLLLDRIPTTTYDAMGNPINHVGVGRDAEHQKFMYGMYNRMRVSAIFLRIVVTKMMEKKILTYESVMHALNILIMFNEGQRPLFERGIKAYFEGDYIVACHVLTPLFEYAVRMLVASQGGEILQHEQNPIDGNRYISLDGLLESDVLKKVFVEDILVYFKNLFTDHNGWNLRNQISHGLLAANSFSATMADRIVHAFMVLSAIKVETAFV